MHRAFPLTAALVIASLVFCGCADLPPGEAGVFSNSGAVAGGDMARSLTVTSAQGQAGGAGGTLVTATINVIATHQASERQRRIAETRAKAAVAKLRARQEREHTAAVAKARKAATARPPEPKKSRSGKPEPKIAASVREVDVTRTVPRKKLPRYIAVETVKDERTAPQAAKALMIFDTQTQEIVGNNVYDVRSTPQIGATARFETFTAEYVGAGE